MDIKAKILKRIAGIQEDIIYMISHHILTYLSVIIMSILGIIILFFLYQIISIFSNNLASYVVWVLGILLYFYFLLNFLDIYLDAVIVTNSSVIIYKWYGIFKSTSDVLFLEAIESVYADQEWIIDTLFNKGDIVLRRAGHENKFDSVYNPNDVAAKLNNILNSVSKESEEDSEGESKEDDFKLFVEAMAEVIKEYWLKKK